MRTALQAQRYDVIHVHTPHAGFLLMVTLLLSGLYGRLQPKTVHTIQNSFQNFKLRNKLLFLPSFVTFQRLVFCSQASYKSFPAFMKWLGRGRIDVVQNAVDLARVEHRLSQIEANRENGRFRIVTVGLIAMKNPLTLFNAFQESADGQSQLTYLGEGKLRPQLEEQIDRHGFANHVTLTGMISRDEVFRHFGTADLFVSTSWGEGLPVAVLEAMACGCPVLLSDIAPHREIAERVNFIPLVAPGDAASFAHHIQTFRTMSPEKRKIIGQQCRKLVETRFSLSAMHKGYADVYLKVTGKRFPAYVESLA